MRIGKFLFLALVAASFVACNDDDDSGKTATEKALITKLYSYSAEEPEQSVSEETLTYDSQGRLTKWNQKNTANGELLIERTATYTYGDGTVSVAFAGADTYEVQLDKAGRASRVERDGNVITMTYEIIISEKNYFSNSFFIISFNNFGFALPFVSFIA